MSKGRKSRALFASKFGVVAAAAEDILDVVGQHQAAAELDIGMDIGQQLDPGVGYHVLDAGRDAGQGEQLSRATVGGQDDIRADLDGVGRRRVGIALVAKEVIQLGEAADVVRRDFPDVKLHVVV